MSEGIRISRLSDIKRVWLLVVGAKSNREVTLSPLLMKVMVNLNPKIADRFPDGFEDLGIDIQTWHMDSKEDAALKVGLTLKEIRQKLPNVRGFIQVGQLGVFSELYDFWLVTFIDRSPKVLGVEPDIVFVGTREGIELSTGTET